MSDHTPQPPAGQPSTRSTSPEDAAPKPLLQVVMFGDVTAAGLRAMESRITSSLPEPVVAVLLRHLAAAVESGGGIHMPVQPS